MASRRAQLNARLRRYEEKYQKLAAQLAETGYLYDGTVGRQWLTCGKDNCACASDPARRHGPYAYWTTKLKGRTVSRRLSLDEAQLLEVWVENRRELERIKNEMIRLSKKVAPVLLELQTHKSDA
jgi:hypothetical protein